VCHRTRSRYSAAISTWCSPPAWWCAAFWPVLWGRAFRDVIGGGCEYDLASWAEGWLAVEGTRPAIRGGEQPYGLLPTSAFAAWVSGPDDPLAPIEEIIREWALAWQAGAPAAAEQVNPWVEGAGTEQLLDVLGLHAPSRYWRVRPVAAAAVTAERIFAGMDPLGVTDWERATAWAWRGWPYPAFPIAPAAYAGQIPGPPADALEDPKRLKALCTMPGEPLYYQGDPPLVSRSRVC
jgi:hypothetical protein